MGAGACRWRERTSKCAGQQGRDPVTLDVIVFCGARGLLVLQKQTAAGEVGWEERLLEVCDGRVTVLSLAGADSPGLGGHRRGQGEGSPRSGKDRCRL